MSVSICRGVPAVCCPRHEPLLQIGVRTILRDQRVPRLAVQEDRHISTTCTSATWVCIILRVRVDIEAPLRAALDCGAEADNDNLAEVYVSIYPTFKL